VSAEGVTRLLHEMVSGYRSHFHRKDSALCSSDDTRLKLAIPSRGIDMRSGHRISVGEQVRFDGHDGNGDPGAGPLA
jgi:hypothetical protein